MAIIEIWDEVQCGAGVPLRQITDWIQVQYGEALAGDVGATLTLPLSSPALADCAVRNVLRIEDNGVISEFRILRLDDEVTSPVATVTCAPILHDLGRAPLVQTISGLQVYSLAATALTPVQWIDNYILPSLTTNGITWVGRGTVDLTGMVTLSYDSQTPLGLLRAVVANTSYEVSLRRNGATNYLIDLVVIDKTGGVSPVAFVGRNVRSLQRTIDGDPQLTVVVPTGITPSGDTRPSGIERVAFTVHTNPSGATVKIKDAKTGQRVLLRDDQLNGLYAAPDQAVPLHRPYSYWMPELTLLYSTGYQNPQGVAYCSGDGCFYVASRKIGTSPQPIRILRFNPSTGLWTGSWSVTPTNTTYFLGFGVSAAGNVLVVTAGPSTDAVFYFNRLNTGTGVWSTEQSVAGAAGTYSDVISLLIFPWMTNQSAWWVNANNDVGNRNFHVTDANPPVATSTGSSAYSPNSIMWYKAGGGGTDRVFFQGGSTNTSIMSYNPNGTPATSTLWTIPSGMGGTVWYCAANDLFYVSNQNYQTYVVNASGTLVGFVRRETASARGFTYYPSWAYHNYAGSVFDGNGYMYFRGFADASTARYLRLSTTAIANYCPYSEYLESWTAAGANANSAGADPIYNEQQSSGDFQEHAASLSRISANTDHRYAILKTMTGDGTKAVSVYLKYATSTQTEISLYDSTAATVRHLVRVSWSGGVPTLSTVSGSGTLIGVELIPPTSVSDWYRIKFTVNNVVAANTNHLRIYPCTNGTGFEYVYAWGAQVEDGSTVNSYCGTGAQNAWSPGSWSRNGYVPGLKPGKTYTDNLPQVMWWDSTRSRFLFFPVTTGEVASGGTGMYFLNPEATSAAGGDTVLISDSVADDGTGVSTITPASTVMFKDFGAFEAAGTLGGTTFSLLRNASGDQMSELIHAGAVNTYGRIVGFVDGARYGYRGERQLCLDPLQKYSHTGANTYPILWGPTTATLGGTTGYYFNPTFQHRGASHGVLQQSKSNILTNGSQADGTRSLVIDGFAANEWIPAGTRLTINTYLANGASVCEDTQANGSGSVTVKITAPIASGPCPDNTGVICVFPSAPAVPSWSSGKGFIISADHCYSAYAGPWQDHYGLTGKWHRNIFIPSRYVGLTLRVTVWYGHWSAYSDSWNDTLFKLYAGAQSASGVGTGTNGATPGVKNLTIAQTLTGLMTDCAFPIGVGLDNSGYTTVRGYVIYGISAYIGTETLSEPFENSHANDLWQFGGNILQDVSEPPVAYQLQVLEDDPAAPFALGGTVTLRDPDRGIAATPRIVAVQRTLKQVGTAEIAEPVIELENRPQSLVQGLVRKGSI